jgi:hypothetical protein
MYITQNNFNKICSLYFWRYISKPYFMTTVSLSPQKFAQRTQWYRYCLHGTEKRKHGLTYGHVTFTPRSTNDMEVIAIETDTTILEVKLPFLYKECTQKTRSGFPEKKNRCIVLSNVPPSRKLKDIYNKATLESLMKSILCQNTSLLL